MKITGKKRTDCINYDKCPSCSGHLIWFDGEPNFEIYTCEACNRKWLIKDGRTVEEYTD